GLNQPGQYREHSVAHAIASGVACDHLQFWHVLCLPTPEDFWDV
ncbi:MAG: hypothetical protein QOD02_715, partial [Mycobacterium sp.]|nr:hypothetical protein [Mycobacterium sp.]